MAIIKLNTAVNPKLLVTVNCKLETLTSANRIILSVRNDLVYALENKNPKTRPD